MQPLRMIDVGDKPVTRRMARASGLIRAQPATIVRLAAGDLEKGDALTAAHFAGVMAAKQTSTLVPLCHPLPLDAVELALTICGPEYVSIEATVRATTRTGVEMEALCAVTAAALTIYDMCKSIDRTMSIESIRLEEKTGGIRGNFLLS